MKIILGMDIALVNSGIAILRGNQTNYDIKTYVLSTKSKGISRLQEGELLLKGILETEGIKKIDLTVIEGFAYGVDVGRLFEIGEFTGVLKLFLSRNYNCQFLIVSPPALKKYITGSGRAKKEEILLKAYKKWNIEKTDHETEAFALALVGYNLLFRKENSLLGYEKEVLKSLMKGGKIENV